MRCVACGRSIKRAAAVDDKGAYGPVCGRQIFLRQRRMALIAEAANSRNEPRRETSVRRFKKRPIDPAQVDWISTYTESA